MPMKSEGRGKSVATSPGALRMPEPMVLPIATATPKTTPSSRSSPRRGPTSVDRAREEAVEVMDPRLAGRRVAAAVVETRADAALHLLDDLLVFALDAFESAARPRALPRGVQHPAAVDDSRAVDRQRHHDVERQPPGIEIQH